MSRAGEGVGKAGGYAIQGRAETLVKEIPALIPMWWACRWR